MQEPKQVDPRTKAAIEGLALEVLQNARALLTVRLRFLDRALGQMRPDAGDIRFGTDGNSLLYEPWQVLVDYDDEPPRVAHKYLHTLLHNIFCHSRGLSSSLDPHLWDLSCDIAVESLILSLDLDTVSVAAQERQKHELFLLRQEDARFGSMTADQMYRWFREHDLPKEERDRLSGIFKMDDHLLWYEHETEQDDKQKMKREREEQTWMEISRRIQTELETLQKDRTGSAELAQGLKELHRHKVDYKAFLRKFGLLMETMKVSEEEFDYAYYKYGLDHYGNMPLVEPLEYSEDRRIRDFAIAVDTSGSVRGEVVQSFVQLTFDLLTQDETFFSKMSLYLIQCDDRIRAAERITTPEQFPAALQSMVIEGLGGTDFRPVFEHIAKAQQEGTMPQLQGLLYFTDGNGTYPSKRPPYPVAFILSNNLFENDVPPWAMRVRMNEEEILDV